MENSFKTLDIRIYDLKKKRDITLTIVPVSGYAIFFNFLFNHYRLFLIIYFEYNIITSKKTSLDVNINQTG